VARKLAEQTDAFRDYCKWVGGESSQDESGTTVCAVSDEDSFFGAAVLAQNFGEGFRAEYGYQDGHERVDADLAVWSGEVEMSGSKMSYEALTDEQFSDWFVDKLTEAGVSEEKANEIAGGPDAEAAVQRALEFVSLIHEGEKSYLVGEAPKGVAPYVWEKVSCEAFTDDVSGSTFPRCAVKVSMRGHMPVSRVFGDVSAALDYGVQRASSLFYGEIDRFVDGMGKIYGKKG